MSVLKLKNTYTRSVETFQPLDPEGRRVTMYSCGPTVYSYAHIGNFRSFLMSDVLRRVLERNGYEVRHVMNITDVGHLTEDDVADAQGEDKLQKAAREMGWDPYKLARFYEHAFVEDARHLRMKNYSGGEAGEPELHPRAAGHVPEMLELIQKLIENDHAYVDDSGQVYFDIQKFPEYGKLSGKVIDDLEAGARVAVGEHKRDPRDFYLWKVDPKHLMQWDPHSDKGWDAADYERYRQLLPDGVDEREVLLHQRVADNGLNLGTVMLGEATGGLLEGLPEDGRPHGRRALVGQGLAREAERGLVAAAGVGVVAAGAVGRRAGQDQLDPQSWQPASLRH